MAGAPKRLNLFEASRLADVQIMLESADENVLTKGLERLSSHLREGNGSIQIAIDLGLVSRVAEWLKAENFDLKVAAAMVLRNIAAGTNAEAKSIVDAGCLESLAPLLSNANSELKISAYIALCKVCSSGHQAVCTLIDAGVVDSLLEALADANSVHDKRAKDGPYVFEAAVLMATRILYSIMENSDALYYKRARPLLLKYGSLFCCESQKVRTLMNTIGGGFVYGDIDSLAEEVTKDLLPILENGLQFKYLTEDPYLAAPYLNLVRNNIGHVKFMLDSGTFSLIKGITEKSIVFVNSQHDQEKNFAILATSYLVMNLCKVLSELPHLSLKLINDGYLSIALQMMACRIQTIQFWGMSFWLWLATYSNDNDNCRFSENIIQQMIQNGELRHVNKCFSQLLKVPKKERDTWNLSFDIVRKKLSDLCIYILEILNLDTVVYDSGLLKTFAEMLDCGSVEIRIAALGFFNKVTHKNIELSHKTLDELNLLAKVTELILSPEEGEADFAMQNVFLLIFWKAPITEFAASKTFENVAKYLIKNQGKSEAEFLSSKVLRELCCACFSEAQTKECISGIFLVIKMLVSTNSDDLQLDAMKILFSVLCHESLRHLCFPLVRTAIDLAATTSICKTFFFSTSSIVIILQECTVSQIKECFQSENLENISMGFNRCYSKAVTENDFYSLKDTFTAFDCFYNFAEALGFELPCFEISSTLIKLTKHSDITIADASKTALLSHLLRASAYEKSFEEILGSEGGFWFANYYKNTESEDFVNYDVRKVLRKLKKAINRFPEVSSRYENQVLYIRQLSSGQWWKKLLCL